MFFYSIIINFDRKATFLSVTKDNIECLLWQKGHSSPSPAKILTIQLIKDFKNLADKTKANSKNMTKNIKKIKDM